jgi:hypothetical protein
MRHIVEYVESGKPVIGIRTATHAFAYEPDSTSPYARWSWNSKEWPGGFGKQVLGETWISHHGNHGVESTRGIVPAAVKENPILRGVSDVWGTTDVYGIGALPSDTTVLLEGSILESLDPLSKPVADGRNAPRMPIVWIRERKLDGDQDGDLDGDLAGDKVQRVACSTIGAAIDLPSRDLRRLLVNLCYWGVGLEDKISVEPRVEVVGEFEPTMFGFGAHRRGLKPTDLALPKPPAKPVSPESPR